MKNRSSLTAEYMALFRILESSRPERLRLFCVSSHLFSSTNGAQTTMISFGQCHLRPTFNRDALRKERFPLFSPRCGVA